MSNATSLKAKIRNLAKQKNIPAQVLLQNYMFERLLVRLSQSEHRDRFVLKGGMLVAAIVGLDHRATMDLDTTLRGLPLTETAIRSALDSICSVPLDDGVSFSVKSIGQIRQDDVYGGYRVSLEAVLETMRVPMSIDVTTGDAITPAAIRYRFSEMFNADKSFELWAYNIETVLAEKAETILRRGVFNTRPRDYYDAYILAGTQAYDPVLFAEALKATAEHRGTLEQIKNVDGILADIESSAQLQEMWEKYRKQFSYASEISWGAIVAQLRKLTAAIQP